MTTSPQIHFSILTNLASINTIPQKLCLSLCTINWRQPSESIMPLSSRHLRRIRHYRPQSPSSSTLYNFDCSVKFLSNNGLPYKLKWCDNHAYSGLMQWIVCELSNLSSKLTDTKANQKTRSKNTCTTLFLQFASDFSFSSLSFLPNLVTSFIWWTGINFGRLGFPFLVFSVSRFKPVARSKPILSGKTMIKPVWYENLAGVLIRPDKSRHKHRWCW